MTAEGRTLSLRKRLFWWTERADDWLFDHAPNKVWEWFPTGAINSACCAVLGHVPISTCAKPEHDACAYCRVSTPGQGR